MAFLVPFPKFYATDTNGRPLVGGKLFTYEAGTTTKVNTYTDSTGGVANTNPVLMDASGWANVWVDPAILYKFVLSPPTDTDPPTNPLWTVDYIGVPEAPIPQPLTRVNDTNVTLTLGGSPSTALLSATSITVGWSGTLAADRLNANVVQAVVSDTNVTGAIATQTLTIGWTGTLGVARGGTNIASYTAGDLLYASDTTVLSKLGIGDEGQVLSVTSGIPAWEDGGVAIGDSIIGGEENCILFIDPDGLLAQEDDYFMYFTDGPGDNGLKTFLIGGVATGSGGTPTGPTDAKVKHILRDTAHIGPQDYYVIGDPDGDEESDGIVVAPAINHNNCYIECSTTEQVGDGVQIMMGMVEGVGRLATLFGDSSSVFSSPPLAIAVGARATNGTGVYLNNDIHVSVHMGMDSPMTDDDCQLYVGTRAIPATGFSIWMEKGYRSDQRNMLKRITDPASPPPDGNLYYYCREKTGDAGKEELVVMWPDGSTSVLVAEP